MPAFTAGRGADETDDVTGERSLYADTTKRSGDGQYVVELPFRQGGVPIAVTGEVRRTVPEDVRKIPIVYATYLALNYMEVIATDELNTVPHC